MTSYFAAIARITAIVTKFPIATNQRVSLEKEIFLVHVKLKDTQKQLHNDKQKPKIKKKRENSTSLNKKHILMQ